MTTKTTANNAANTTSSNESALLKKTKTTTVKDSSNTHKYGSVALAAVTGALAAGHKMITGEFNTTNAVSAVAGAVIGAGVQWIAADKIESTAGKYACAIGAGAIGGGIVIGGQMAFSKFGMSAEEASDIVTQISAEGLEIQTAENN